jgi:hypothetical protein
MGPQKERRLATGGNAPQVAIAGRPCGRQKARGMNSMTISADARALMALDPDFNTALSKDQPGVGDVHVSSAGGGKKPKRKPLTFTEGIEDISTIKSFEDILGATAVDGASEQIEAILKGEGGGNPNHDERGRFAEGSGGAGDKGPVSVGRVPGYGDSAPEFAHAFMSKYPSMGEGAAALDRMSVGSLNNGIKALEGHIDPISNHMRGMAQASLSRRTTKGDFLSILESGSADDAQLLGLRKAAPALKPHPDGGAHVPFPYDAQALDKIDPKHTRMFLGALTNPDALPTRRVPIKSLVAIQPRVSPEKVADMQASGYSKLPTVVRNDGKNLLADGNHRAAASLLDGETAIDCKYLRLSGEDESLAKIEDAEFKFVVKSADPDEQLIFGWASIVQKGDYLVIDKQGDMILPEELEKAAYDFLLDGGQHGHLHATIGTGRPVESMVFTKEKQAALGIVIKDADSGEQIVGWWTGFKVDDPVVWAKHKSGELPEFSIGGASMSVKMDE